MTDFSINAPVGQASTQAPQDTHSDSRNGCCCEATTRDSSAAALDGQRERALGFLAGAHAARADDAEVIVEAEVWIAGVDGLVSVHVPRGLLRPRIAIR